MSRRATGLRAWVVQRVSAVYLALFFLMAAGYFLLDPPGSFDEWRGVVASPLVSTGVLLAMVALLLHAWVGIRDVLIDYVPPLAARLTLLTMFGLGFVASGIWALQVILLARAGG